MFNKTYLNPHYEHVKPKKINERDSLVDSEQPLDQITTRNVYGHPRDWLHVLKYPSCKVKGDISISKRS